MTALTIREVSRHSGSSEPTPGYDEHVGLVGPIHRDKNSGHRRHRTEDLNNLRAPACLRAVGVAVEEIRVHQGDRPRGRAAAARRDRLLRHTECIEAEIVAQRARPGYLRTEATVGDARDRGDTVAQAEATQRAVDAAGRSCALR